jgi:hypothetical protein
VEQTQKEKRNGQIFAAVFIAIVLLPLCYVILKEFVFSKEDHDKIEQAPVTAPAR